LDKAPDAFRTISEVAEDLDIPQHVLRFWESRFAQIKPMKRAGGRRSYRPEDVDLLRGIRHLLYGEGYTIRGVQRILKEHGGRFVQSVWQAGAEQPQPIPGDIAVEQAGSSAALSGAAQKSDPAMFRPIDREVEDVPARADVPLQEVAAPADRHMPAGLSEEKRQQLHAVLDDLAECRRLLETGLRPSA
jgi:DNA-binding transcriptional MerR regulator